MVQPGASSDHNLLVLQLSLLPRCQFGGLAAWLSLFASKTQRMCPRVAVLLPGVGGYTRTHFQKSVVGTVLARLAKPQCKI